MSGTTPTTVREGEAPSLVRTYTPVIVGAIVSYLFGLDVVAEILDTFGVTVEQATVGFTVVVTAILTAIYYTVARFLETRVKPQFGWLLGLAKLPIYTEARDVASRRVTRNDAGYGLVEVCLAVLVIVVVLILLLRYL